MDESAWHDLAPTLIHHCPEDLRISGNMRELKEIMSSKAVRKKYFDKFFEV